MGAGRCQGEEADELFLALPIQCLKDPAFSLLLLCHLPEESATTSGRMGRPSKRPLSILSQNGIPNEPPRTDLTIAQCGATCRTRYFAVRGARLHEEHAAGRASLEYCKTGDMLTDALIKLTPAPVIAILHSAMHGELPIPSTPTVSSALVGGSCEQM